MFYFFSQIVRRPLHNYLSCPEYFSFAFCLYCSFLSSCSWNFFSCAITLGLSPLLIALSISMDRSIPYSSLTIFTAYLIWSICLNSSCTLALSSVKFCISFSRLDIYFCQSRNFIADVPVNFSMVFLALRYLSISFL